MLPRHPLILKITTICTTVVLVGVLFYHRNPDAVVHRRLMYLQTLQPGRYSLSDITVLVQQLQAIQNPTPPTTTTEEPIHAIETYVDGDAIAFEIDAEPCSKSHYLLIYVHSGPENAERRRVIRTSWASNEILELHGAKLIFVTGHVEKLDLQASLEFESQLHKDIIQANFTDTYKNLTYKAISGLRWAQDNCPNTTYVLKTDDDIVVDIHRVVRLMKAYIENKWGKKNILAGYIWPHMNVDRNTSSKWYVTPEEFPKPFYLKYCSGSAYLMSSDVVAKFYTNSLTTPFFWIDDYYVTGMLASAAGVTPTSLNDRYILENNADMAGLLQNDSKTRFVFVHSPDTVTSNFVWKKFLERWV